MANSSYLQDLEDEDQPYSSIADRDPLEPLSQVPSGYNPQQRALLQQDNQDDSQGASRSPAGFLDSDNYKLQILFGKNSNDVAPLPNNPNSCLAPAPAPSPMPSPRQQVINSIKKRKKLPPPQQRQPAAPPQTPPNPTSVIVNQTQQNPNDQQANQPLDLGNEPRISGLIDQYIQGENDLPNLRRAQMDPYLIQNIATASGQAALGPQTPQMNDQFYKNLQTQNRSVLDDSNSDLNRRQKVIDAIILSNRKLNGKQGGLTDYQKASLANQDRLYNFRKQQQGTTNQQNDDRINRGNISTVDSLFARPNISQQVNKLNTAQAGQSILDEVRSGKLVGSSNVANQLTNLIQMTEMGGPGDAAGRHEAGVNNLYSAAQKAKSYWLSTPNPSMNDATMQQLETELHALQSRALKTYKTNTDSVIAGASPVPGNTNPNADQVYKMAGQRQQKFLNDNQMKAPNPTSSNGFPRKIYNDETGESVTVSNPDELQKAGLKGFH